MTIRRLILAGVMVAGTAFAATASPTAKLAASGVPDSRRAEVNWTLKCQGCHRPDGGGSASTAPPLAGHVSRFTALPGGREYLGRVPGVTDAALSDKDLAELLNWTLARFDPAHLPAGFEPYTASEIGQLRKHPLRTEAATARAAILKGAR